VIYNGTDKPELLTLSVSELQTSLTYTFNLNSMNKIFTSELNSELVIKVGTVPSKPGQPTYLYELYEAGTMTVAWT
jgi:hypothetical protein